MSYTSPYQMIQNRREPSHGLICHSLRPKILDGQNGSDSLMIDPVQRYKIEEIIRKQELLKKVSFQIQSQKSVRRQGIAKRAEQKVLERQSYLQKMQMKLQNFEISAKDSKNKFSEQLQEEEKDRVKTIESVVEKGQKNLEIFEERAEQKRRQLQDAISHERKVIEKLNQQALRQAKNKVEAAGNSVQGKKVRLLQEIDREKQYYMNIIQRMQQQVKEAKRQAESQVLEDKLKQEEEIQLQKRTRVFQKTNSIQRVREQKQALPQIKLSYTEQFMRSREALQNLATKQNLLNPHHQNTSHDPTGISIYQKMYGRNYENSIIGSLTKPLY